MSRRPWPVRKAPLAGEVFSSWLLRNIRAFGDTPHAFCKGQWPTRQFWTRDLDRSVSDEVVRDLSESTRVDPAVAQGTLLASGIERVTRDWRRHGIIPWVLPVGVFHRVRTRFGQQVCPQCLATDEEPYLRKTWRLATSVACLRHRCQLLDACPYCEAPIVPHRSPLLRVWLCHKCTKDLRMEPKPADDGQIAAQRFVEDAVDSGVVSVNGLAVESADFLSGVRLFFVALRGRSGAARLASHCRPTVEPPQAPELLRVGRRLDWLPPILELLNDWPARLLAAAEQCGATYGSIVPHGHHAPGWMQEGLSRLPRAVRAKRRRRRRFTGSPRMSWRTAFEYGVAKDGLASFVSSRIDALEQGS